MLGEFKRHYPEVRVTLRIDDSKGILEAVKEGEIELGVVGAKLGNAKLEYVEFLHDELVLVVPASHPLAGRGRVSMAEVQRQPFILRERGSGSRRIFEDLSRQHGIDPASFSVAAEMGSNVAVLQGIKAGVGLSILSRRAVADDVAAGRLQVVTIKDVHFLRCFYIVSRRGHTMSPICRLFQRFPLEQRDAAAAAT